MTAAATTGPASGPLPASSQPATGQTPRLSAARSRRKVGRTILLAERQAGGAMAVAAQLMPRWCAARRQVNAARSSRVWNRGEKLALSPATSRGRPS